MINNHSHLQITAVDQQSPAMVPVQQGHSNETSASKPVNGANSQMNWAQMQNNPHLQNPNLVASQYLQFMQSNNSFVGSFPNNSQSNTNSTSNLDSKKNAFTNFTENDLFSKLPQAQNSFQYQNFNQLDLSQFQLPPQFELESSQNYMDCLTPNFFNANARPPPPTPDSPFLLTNPYLELSGLTPSQFNLPLTPSSRSSPYGMHLIPPETLLPPSAFPDQENGAQGVPVQLSCTSLFDQNNVTSTKSESPTASKSQTAFSSNSNNNNNAQGLATASSLLCLDKNSDSFTEPVIEQTVPSKINNKTAPVIVKPIPVAPHTAEANKSQGVNNSHPESTSSPQASPSLNPNIIRAPSSLISSNHNASPVLNAPRSKRFKKTSSVRKLLPLLPTLKPATTDLDSQSILSTSITESPMLAPISSNNASPLTLLPQNSLTAQLASKSNYQLLREGRTSELGLDFGPEATESLNRKRQAHKDAERLRRQNQTDQLQALRQVLPQLSSSASKMAVLSEARESLINFDSLVKQQNQWIKLLLDKLSPDGKFPSDLPSELEKYFSDPLDTPKN